MPRRRKLRATSKRASDSKSSLNFSDLSDRDSSDRDSSYRDTGSDASKKINYKLLAMSGGVLAVLAWWLLRSNSATAASLPARTEQIPPQLAANIQQRPFPNRLSDLDEAGLRRYATTAQVQLYALRWLANRSQITGDLDTDTKRALAAFIAADAARSVAMAAAHTGNPETTRDVVVSLDVLDQTFRSVVEQRPAPNAFGPATGAAA